MEILYKKKFRVNSKVYRVDSNFERLLWGKIRIFSYTTEESTVDRPLEVRISR